jgi:orotidine-5'-phosphate decarboxylase
VFGATNIKELEENLAVIKDLPLLIPGVGAQGGSLEDIIRILFSGNKSSFLINVSRGIIQKSLGEDFAEAAKNELSSLNKIISQNLQLKN